MEDETKKIQALFDDAAAPRPAFVKSLKGAVVSANHMRATRSNLLYQLFMKMPKKSLIAATVVGITALGVGALYYASQLPPVANQEVILSHIAEAYQNAQSSHSSLQATADSATGTAAKMMPFMYRDPSSRTYNFKTTETTYAFGPAAARCSATIPYGQDVTKVTYAEFYADKNEMWPSYTKSVLYQGNDIYDYNLTTKDGRWQYRGGSYAVRITNEPQIRPLMFQGERTPTARELASSDTATGSGNRLIATAVPAPSGTTVPAQTGTPTITDTPTPTQSPSDIIKNQFGDHAKILKLVQKNGKTYYQIEWTYPVMCDTSAVKNGTISTTDEQNGVMVALADSQSFSMTDQALYLDSYAAQNLVYAQTVNETEKNVDDLSYTGSTFTFSEPVSVKTIDASKTDETKAYNAALTSFIGQKNVPVVYVSGKSYQLTYLNSSFVTVVPETQKQLVDRSFYSDKPYGEKLYQDNKNMFTPTQEAGKTYPQWSFNYSSSKAKLGWLSVAQYDGVYEGQSAIEQLGDSSTKLKLLGTSTIALNDQQVPVTAYTVVQDVVPPQAPDTSSSSGTTAEKVPNEQVYFSYTIAFVYNGQTIVVQTSGNKMTAKQLIVQLPFAVVAAGESKKLNTVLTVPAQKPAILY